MKNFGIILLVSGGLLKVQAAADVQSVIISTDYINRLVAEARTNNPSLKAADARVRAATLNAEAVRTWEDPGFLVGGSTFSASGMNPAQFGDLAYGLEQKLPLWGRPKLTRHAAATETSLRLADAHYRLQQLRRALSKELLSAALAERVVEIGEQDLAWLEATVKAVEARYRDGQAALADTLQIENELAERNANLDRSIEDRSELNRQLAQAQADAQSLEARLSVIGIQSSQDTLQSLALKTQVNDLKAEIEEKDKEVRAYLSLCPERAPPGTGR